MSDLANLLKELEQVAKDTNLKEVKKEPLEESVTSKDDVSSLFEGLEAAYTESKIEEEIKNRLSEEDEQKLNAFSGFMQSVTELTNKPDSNKSIEDLFATITPPQPQTEIIPDIPIVEEIIEDIVEEPTEIEQADTIIEQIVSSLDDMNDKTDVQEQVEQISKLRDEFNNFRSLVQQQMSSTGSGEVKLEFLDDVQRSTAKVDGKFLKFDSSSGKFVGDEPSVTSLAITALDIDGGTDIGADLADADLIIVDDGAGGTNRKSTLARLKTYIGSGSGSSAADDITAGDAAVNITTSSGNITIDAAANNSDIILKGTDGGSDTTFLTIDGSAAGKATFNDEIVSGAVITSGAGLVIADNGNIGSASDTDAIAIASDGVVTMNQIPVFSAGINVSGGTIAGTLSTAAQGNITSLGTLTALTVDNVVVNGATIGHTDDTDLMTVADGVLTVAGEVDAVSLDVSGDADIDGTLEADAITVNGTALASSATTDTTNASNIGSGTLAAARMAAAQTAITSIFATDLKIGEDDQTKIDFETADEIHFYAANEHQIKLVDGALVPVTDNDIDLGTSSVEFKDAFFDGTVTSDAFAGPLTGDVTGNADTATALATARTIHGVSFDGSANIDLSEVIQDTVGSMFGSNTETGITATYQDSDGTIDLVVGTLNQDTTGNAATATALATARTIGGVSFDGSANIDLLATDIKIGEDDQTKIDFETADEIHFYAANAEQVFVSDGVFGPETDSDVDLGTNSTRFKDAYIDTVTTTGLITSGSNLVIADAGNIGSASDTDAMAIASDGVVTFSQAPVFPDGSINLADLDIDGGTDIGAAIVDADLFIVDDGAGGTNRKTAASRLKTYIQDAGTVLQVVRSSAFTSSTNSTSFVDVTNASVAITPASSSNKIFVMATVDSFQPLVASANQAYTQRLIRTVGGTDTILNTRNLSAQSGAGGLQVFASTAFSELDSPSTTSEVTYKIEHKVNNSGSSGQAGSSGNYIIVMEIQG